jgi:hypothetical protein
MFSFLLPRLFHMMLFHRVLYVAFCFLGCFLEPANVAFLWVFLLCSRSKMVHGCRRTVLLRNG